MNMLQIILENLPWPIVSLFVVFMFRETIKKLINRIIKLKGGGVDINIAPVQPTTTDSGPTGLMISESHKAKTIPNPMNSNIKKEDIQATNKMVDGKTTNSRLKDIEDSFNTISSRSIITYENSIREDLNDLSIEESKQIEILIKALASTQGTLYYEGIHSVIWGSQLSLLHHLNTTSKGSSLEVLKVFYDGGAARDPNLYHNYSFEQYLEYLTANNLIEKRDNRYLITQPGIDYLGYLTLYGRSNPITY
ncbi:MAG: hypothetical protein ACUZ8I_12445 [Candidatus Scalindua sp.]